MMWFILWYITGLISGVACAYANNDIIYYSQIPFYLIVSFLGPILSFMALGILADNRRNKILFNFRKNKDE